MRKAPNKSVKTLPTRAEVLRLLSYDPTTGEFRWKIGSRRRKAGSVAGFSINGYRAIGIAGKYYFAHRLAWLIMSDDPVPAIIDHIDRDRGNNRWENLRGVTHAENLRNAGPRKPYVRTKPYSTTISISSSFQTYVRCQGKASYVGKFKTHEEAVSAGAAKLAELTTQTTEEIA